MSMCLLLLKAKCLVNGEILCMVIRIYYRELVIGTRFIYRPLVEPGKFGVENLMHVVVICIRLLADAKIN